MSTLDEVAMDDLRCRAKAMLRAKGWSPNDRASMHSLIELMTTFGAEISVGKPLDRCAHPECGCDADATCARPCPTPADIAAAVQAERDRCLAAIDGERLEDQLSVADEAYNDAIADAHNAVVTLPPFPSNALAARIAEARRAGMAAAALIAKKWRDGNADAVARCDWTGQQIEAAIRAAMKEQGE